ncbi:DUF1419 domain-containing protein [Thalassobaculum salexigens]|uniref:DUF1419 domain-containing protein n=1 Tax=Thalassobaculum salexigens TaxID=455360 RepID=UPI000423E8BA|nr:DUF1419 domain-containing protein [Thalassobaculum salexigens]
MKVLPNAAGNWDLHYQNLNTREGDDWAGQHGNVWQIDDSIYSYFLDILPPIYLRTARGFLVSEALTGEIHSAFFQIGTRFYCGYVRRSQAEAEVAELAVAVRDTVSAD